MNIHGYTPTEGFKVEAARDRGLIKNKVLYKIGILIEGFFYCQQSLSLPPTCISLVELQEELRAYQLDLTLKVLVNYLQELGKIQYVTEEYCVPLFAFFSIKVDKNVGECWINFNPYF